LEAAASQRSCSIASAVAAAVQQVFPAASWGITVAAVLLAASDCIKQIDGGNSYSNNTSHFDI